MRYLTMKGFTFDGRFANQLFQYTFLRLYAMKHGLELQLHPWVGNELFGLCNPPITVDLPVQPERYTRPGGTTLPPEGEEFVGKDFRGYGQLHTSWFRPHRDQIREWFRPVPSVQDRLEVAARTLRGAGRTRIGIHLRRGDYGRSNFPIIPTSWYLKWLEANWGRYDRPVLYIATETMELVEEFSTYSPLTTQRLGVNLSRKPLEHYVYLPLDVRVREPWQMDFYPDFHLLQQCEILLTPSSTYSYFAAMLSTVLKEMYRASLTTVDFQIVDPWNDYPLLRENVKDFRHLAGIASPGNPYFTGR